MQVEISHTQDAAACVRCNPSGDEIQWETFATVVLTEMITSYTDEQRYLAQLSRQSGRHGKQTTLEKKRERVYTL